MSTAPTRHVFKDGGRPVPAPRLERPKPTVRIDATAAEALDPGAEARILSALGDRARPVLERLRAEAVEALARGVDAARALALARRLAELGALLRLADGQTYTVPDDAEAEAEFCRAILPLYLQAPVRDLPALVAAAARQVDLIANRLAELAPTLEDRADDLAGGGTGGVYSADALGRLRAAAREATILDRRRSGLADALTRFPVALASAVSAAVEAAGGEDEVTAGCAAVRFLADPPGSDGAAEVELAGVRAELERLGEPAPGPLAERLKDRAELLAGRIATARTTWRDRVQARAESTVGAVLAGDVDALQQLHLAATARPDAFSTGFARALEDAARSAVEAAGVAGLAVALL